eukprot:scaffold27301_cov15-Tisochrysis_lutea.AAC.1
MPPCLILPFSLSTALIALPTAPFIFLNVLCPLNDQQHKTSLQRFLEVFPTPITPEKRRKKRNTLLLKDQSGGRCLVAAAAAA